MKAVLFDMDGVLVDVSKSYRLTIKKVLERYIKQPLSFQEIQGFKNRGQLNNDWDLTECILLEYGLKIKKPEIVETFQDIYLGNDFNGLIQNEKWLLNKRILVEINRSYKTGIVTGRPKDEALFVLYRFGMEDFFSVVVTMDDIPCGRGKPDPLGIKRALEKLECDEAFYIGDTVDDMMAAQRAKIVPIGIYNECGDKTEQSDLLLKYGAVSILDDVNNILEVLNGQEGKY